MLLTNFSIHQYLFYEGHSPHFHLISVCSLITHPKRIVLSEFSVQVKFHFLYYLFPLTTDMLLVFFMFTFNFHSVKVTQNMSSTLLISFQNLQHWFQIGGARRDPRWYTGRKYVLASKNVFT